MSLDYKVFSSVSAKEFFNITKENEEILDQYSSVACVAPDQLDNYIIFASENVNFIEPSTQKYYLKKGILGYQGFCGCLWVLEEIFFDGKRIKNKNKEFPHACVSCGSPAYVGFNNIICSNKSCAHYVHLEK